MAHRKVNYEDVEPVSNGLHFLRDPLGTEGVFDHYVRWGHSGDTVENFSHWKKVKTGGWLVYWNGMTTNYIDNRDDHGVSKMAGTFNACITNYGCIPTAITSLTSGTIVRRPQLIHGQNKHTYLHRSTPLQTSNF